MPVQAENVSNNFYFSLSCIFLLEKVYERQILIIIISTLFNVNFLSLLFFPRCRPQLFVWKRWKDQLWRISNFWPGNRNTSNQFVTNYINCLWQFMLKTRFFQMYKDDSNKKFLEILFQYCQIFATFPSVVLILYPKFNVKYIL